MNYRLEYVGLPELYAILDGTKADDGESCIVEFVNSEEAGERRIMELDIENHDAAISDLAKHFHEHKRKAIRFPAGSANYLEGVRDEIDERKHDVEKLRRNLKRRLDLEKERETK